MSDVQILTDDEVLRATARLIPFSSDIWALITEYFTDRDLDVVGRDVSRVLHIVADRMAVRS